MRFDRLRLHIGLALALCLTASPAAAVIDLVGKTSARFAWAPASGPVSTYLVYLSRNGGPLSSYALRHYADTNVTVYAQYGDQVQIAVQAISTQNGVTTTSALSAPSEMVRFNAPPPPPAEEPPPPAEEPPPPPAEEPPPPAEEPPPPPAEEPPPAGNAAQVLDFDGDGRADLLLRDKWNGSIGLWFVDGTSAEDAGPGLGSVASGQAIVGNGDYDGDGHADMLLTNSSTGVMELRFLVAGEVVSVKTFRYSTDSSVVGSGDFDGDGADDVVLRNNDTSEAQLWTGLQRGTEPAVLPVALSRSARIRGAGDHDGDGDADLLAQAWDNLWILHLESQQVVGETLLGKIRPRSERVEGVCDVDGDLADDALLVTDEGNLDALLAAGPQRVRVLSGLAAGSLFGTGDYDGDGDCDVALRSPDGGPVTLVVLEDGAAVGQASLGDLSRRWVSAGVGREAP